jgi:hypothetical protein
MIQFMITSQVNHYLYVLGNIKDNKVFLVYLNYIMIMNYRHPIYKFKSIRFFFDKLYPIFFARCLE